MTIGKRIKSVRKSLNITQKSLAEQISLSPSFLCDVENGRTNLPITALIDIAKVLNTTVAYLVGESDTQQLIPKSIIEIALNLSSSIDGAEILQNLADFHNWSDSDKDELVNYLHAKHLLRNTQNNK